MSDETIPLIDGYNSSPLFILGVSGGKVVYANSSARAVASAPCVGESSEFILGEDAASAGNSGGFILRNSSFFGKPCLLEFHPGDPEIYIFTPYDEKAIDGNLNALFSFATNLREPITEMFQALELFRGAKALPKNAVKAERYHSVMEHDLYKLLRISEYISAAAFLSSPEAEFSPKTDDMAELVSSVVAASQPICGHLGIPVRLCCEKNSVFSVFDRTLIEKMLLSLISNSAKYTRDGNEITIRLTKNPENTMLFLSVEDSGTGISPELFPNLLTFLPSDIPSDINRHGLGLRIAHGIARVHGGNIAIETRHGEGTTITVSLPLRAMPPQFEQFTPLYGGIPMEFVEFSPLLSSEDFMRLKQKK